MRELLREWAEAGETFFLEVVFEERHDFKARFTRAILFLFSKVFTGLIKIRRWLYNVRILRDRTLGVQVIAIGNLTVGGTGKTPLVCWLVARLGELGFRPGVVSDRKSVV